jgi:hypothetical protein
MKISELVEFQRAELKKVDLSSFQSEGKEIHSIEIFDEVKVDLKDNILKIFFTRKIESEEQFSLHVIFEIMWKVSENKTAQVRKIIKKLDNDDIDFLLNTSADEASLIIAQLTKALNLLPVITPPIYCPSK